MTAAKAVRDLLEERAMEMSALARIIGVSPSATRERLKQENISVKALNQMLHALDYQIVIQPKGKKLVDGAMVIE